MMFLKWTTPTIVLSLLLTSFSSIEASENDKVCKINSNDECDAEIPNYDETEALKYVLFSKISFCTEESISSWSCGDLCERAPVTSKDKVRFIPEGKFYQVQGFVAQIPTQEDSTKCVVSFRGSNGGKFMNWMANLSYVLSKWPLGKPAGAEWCKGCKVHSGWARAYAELRGQIHRAVEDLGCTSLVVTGHSLGSAVATIASLDLRMSKKKYHVEATYAFGMPRVGNRAFVDAFEKAAAKQGVVPAIWRVVHYRDPVPRLPPSSSFVHGGLEVYYTERNSSDYLVCPLEEDNSENKSKACMGGVSLWKCLFPSNSDHVSYLQESLRIKDLPEECKKKKRRN